MVMYQLLTTVNSNRVTEGKMKKQKKDLRIGKVNIQHEHRIQNLINNQKILSETSKDIHLYTLYLKIKLSCICFKKRAQILVFNSLTEVGWKWPINTEN